MKPKVSFLIAVYNKEQYIKECIDSCLSQTYDNTEICIVDDGSTDNSLQIIQENYSEISNIKIYSFRKNKGKVAAYNQAYSMSEGIYFALVGADDVNLKHRIEVSIKTIYSKNADLVYGKLLITDDLLNIIKEFDQFDKKLDLKKLLRNNRISGGCSLFNKKIANLAFPIPVEFKYEDWWIGLIAKIMGRIDFSDEYMGLYRLNCSNDNLQKDGKIKTIINNNVKLYQRDFVIYNQLRKFITSSEISDIDRHLILKYITINEIYKTNYIEKNFMKRIGQLKFMTDFTLDRWYFEAFITIFLGNKYDYFLKFIKKIYMNKRR